MEKTDKKKSVKTSQQELKHVQITEIQVPETESDTLSPAQENQKQDTPKNKSKQVKDPLIMYREAYPSNELFHITSDSMVFLENDKGLAELHQRSIGRDLSEIQTLK